MSAEYPDWLWPMIHEGVLSGDIDITDLKIIATEFDRWLKWSESYVATFYRETMRIEAANQREEAIWEGR